MKYAFKASIIALIFACAAFCFLVASPSGKWIHAYFLLTSETSSNYNCFEYWGDLFTTTFTEYTGIEQCNTVVSSDTVDDMDWLNTLKNITDPNPIVQHQIQFIRTKISAAKAVTGALIICGLFLIVGIVSVSVYIHNHRQGKEIYYDLQTNVCCNWGCGTCALPDPCTTTGCITFSYIACFGIGVPAWPSELFIAGRKSVKILSQSLPQGKCTLELYPSYGYFTMVGASCLVALALYFMVRARDYQDKALFPATSVSGSSTTSINDTNVTPPPSSSSSSITTTPSPSTRNTDKPYLPLFYYPSAHSGPAGRTINWESMPKDQSR